MSLRKAALYPAELRVRIGAVYWNKSKGAILFSQLLVIFKFTDSRKRK